MGDLIERSAVIEAVNDLLNDGRSFSDILADLPTVRPIIVANITGGVLQRASGTHDVDIYVLDFDTDGCEDNELIEVEGDNARFGEEAAHVDPEFVRAVIKAISDD